MPISRCVPSQLAVDRLAAVVQKRGAHGDGGVEADLPRHDAGQVRDFLRVIQHVLAVAGAVLQAAHQLLQLRMQVVHAELEGGGLAVLAHRFFHLRLHLLDDFLDAGGMDAAVGDQALDRLLRDFAAVGIEARQDDRARRVVDDEIDAGGLLERADVAALAADDAPLQIVARQIDDRHGRFDGVLGGAALNGFGDVLARLRAGLLARLGVEALDQIRRVAPRVGLDVLQQQVLGLFGRQAGQPLELVLLRGDELLVFRGGGRRGLLALGDASALCAWRSLSLRSAAEVLSAERGLPPVELLLGVGELLRLSRARSRSASVRSSCAFSLASSSASFLRVSASRSASFMMRSACSSARPMVSAAMRLRLATQ